MKAASSLIEIRWSCKYDEVNTHVTRIMVVISTLSAVAAGDSNKSEIGTGIYHLILSRKFLVSMCFLHKIMSILNRLSKIIQEDDIAWISLI